MSNPPHTADHHADDAHGHDHDHVHVTPFWPMFNVFAALIFLTILTVATAQIHEIGFGNTVVKIGHTPHIMLALVIASIKGLLVAAYFMHLRYDKPINTVVVGATLFATALFLGFTLFDLANRDTVIQQEGAAAVVRHPMGNPQGYTDPSGAISPGGNLNIWMHKGDFEDFNKSKVELGVMQFVRQEAEAQLHHNKESHDGDDGHNTQAEPESAPAESNDTNDTNGANNADTPSDSSDAGTEGAN